MLSLDVFGQDLTGPHVRLKSELARSGQEILPDSRQLCSVQSAWGPGPLDMTEPVKPVLGPDQPVTYGRIRAANIVGDPADLVASLSGHVHQ